MSLQGTFDTLSVVELFGLLSTASKTGALRLEAGDHEAAVYVTAGLCCAVESDDVSGPAATDEELVRRLVDTGFAVARQAAGSFRFNDAEPPPFAAELTTRFEPAVAEITEMLGQWREIEATIPSLDVRVRLAPVLRGEEIVLGAQEWSLLVALDGMPSVRELIARRHEPVIQVCRLVKDLAERGAIDIGTDMARPENRVGAPAAAEGKVEVDVVLDPPTELSPALARPERDAASVGHLAPSEPYAPSAAPSASSTTAPTASSTPARGAGGGSGGDRNVSAGQAGVAAVSAAASAVAAAEAEAIAAGLVSRMARSRRGAPDGDGDSQPTERGRTAAESAGGEAAVGVAATEAASVDSGGESSQDRGALLRLFSALKE